MTKALGFGEVREPFDDSRPRRLDQVLAENGTFESRAKAREAIEAGLVAVDGYPVRKPASRIQPGARLTAAPAYPWVSRGGVKLAAALDHFAIDPRGRTCLDVGASTGGFTDVLLSRGAAHVYAVDVGREQLHRRIKADSRVSDWSATDVRALGSGHFPDSPTLAVCDVSFISLTLVLPAVLPLMAPRSSLVALIKPQFEVGRGGTDKGLVRDPAARERACRTVAEAITQAGWSVLGLYPSPITGADGNVEFLIRAEGQ